MPLDQNEKINLSLGGEFRIRGEHFENRDFSEDNDQSYLSQRLAVHGKLSLGGHIKVYGELVHGNSSGQDIFAEDDDLAFHQGFVEITHAVSDDVKVRTRLGRQELAFGSARLMGVREGPNIRRSFDGARLSFSKNKFNIDGFYGREVLPRFGIFDNSSNLFDRGENNPEIWGLYSRFPVLALPGTTELYYIGFDVNSAQFDDSAGPETRHTIGVRRFGKLGKRFKYNTELMYQFGEFGDSDIDAYNLELDWQYELSEKGFKPTPGIRLEWSSGDAAQGDNQLNSYNPLFVNPEYYGLAKIITPVNMASVRPFLSLTPDENFNLYLEFARFWRASRDDGFYRVTRFLSRPSGTDLSNNIGQQFGLKASYKLDRNWTLSLDSSYFLTGDFIRQSGEHENILHIAPTFQFRF